MENAQDLRISSNKCSITIFLLLIIIILNFYLIVRRVSLLKKEYKNNDIKVFKNNYLYKGLFSIYQWFLIIVILLDCICFVIYFSENIDQLNLSLDNLISTFGYFNFLFFGPFQFGVIILCMKYGSEITFIYDEKGNMTHRLNIINAFFIFFYILISFTLTIIVPIFYSFTYFTNSIKFKRYGNYIVGKIFWYFALKYSDGIGLIINNNRENNENQNNNIIQNIINNFDNENNIYIDNIESDN